jgi:ATP-binding cassette subfamily B multidrug efflux pump
MSEKRTRRRPGKMESGAGRGSGSFEKPKNLKETFSKLLGYLRPYRLQLGVVIVFAIGSAAFSIVGPKILGRATTNIFEGLVAKIAGLPGGGIDFGYLGNIILILIGLYLLSAFFSFVQGFIVTGVAQKISYNLRREISQKVNRLPLKYFDTVTHGEVLSRVTNDVDTVSQSLSQSTSQIITSGTSFIGVLIMMISISWQMTLAAILMLPISMALVMVVVKRSQKYFVAQQKNLGYVNGHIEEVYGGHNVMKAFNAEEQVIEEFNKINGELYDSAWKSQFLSGMMMPIMVFIGNLGYVVVSILGGWLAVRKVIEVGDILSFIQYIRNFTQPVLPIKAVVSPGSATKDTPSKTHSSAPGYLKKTSLNSIHPLKSLPNSFGFMGSTITASLSKTSEILWAETEALGNIIETMDIIRKDIIICMVY